MKVLRFPMCECVTDLPNRPSSLTYLSWRCSFTEVSPKTSAVRNQFLFTMTVASVFVVRVDDRLFLPTLFDHDVIHERQCNALMDMFRRCVYLPSTVLYSNSKSAIGNVGPVNNLSSAVVPSKLRCPCRPFVFGKKRIFHSELLRQYL